MVRAVKGFELQCLLHHKRIVDVFFIPEGPRDEVVKSHLIPGVDFGKILKKASGIFWSLLFHHLHELCEIRTYFIMSVGFIFEVHFIHRIQFLHGDVVIGISSCQGEDFLVDGRHHDQSRSHIKGEPFGLDLMHFASGLWPLFVDLHLIPCMLQPYGGRQSGHAGSDNEYSFSHFSFPPFLLRYK